MGPSVGLAVLLSAFAASAADPAASPVETRDHQDMAVLRTLEHRYPGVTKELERGEALLRSGDVNKAAALFGELAKKSPEGGLAARRQCQALTLLGRRDEALAACREASARLVTATTLRASVAAMVLEPLTTTELNIAVRQSEEAKRREPDQPWGLAAECDIAEAIGDHVMLKKCTSELQRVAPGHYETKRRLEAVPAPALPTAVAFGWLVLAFASVGTLLHAAWRGLKGARSLSAAAVLCLVSLIASPAQADEGVGKLVGTSPDSPDGVPIGGLSKWKLNPADPSAGIPSLEDRNRDPINFGYLLMDIADMGFDAAKKGNFAQAAKYWEASARAVPEAAIGFRNACDNWAKAGETAKAITFCRAALGTPGVTTKDHEAFARLVLKKDEPLTEEERTDITEMIAHLRTEVGTEALVLQITCDLGTKLEDPARLKECTDALVKTAPNDAKTITYLWALAMAKGDLAEAERLIDRAQQAGMKPEGLAAMRRGITKEGTLTARFKRHQGLVIGLGVGLVVVLGLVGLFLRRRRLPNPAANHTGGLSAPTAETQAT
jgi:tetratricopeptide (TPR) repeat protein